jgi:hypothetical protein
MAAKRAKVAEAPDPLQHARRLQDLIPELGVEAMRFTSQSKVEETTHQWIGRCDLHPDDSGSVDVVAQSLVFALELATFTPSLCGGAAIGRLARQRKSTDGEEKAALDAASSQLRLLRIRSPARDGLVQLEDLATGATLSFLDRDIPATLAGLALAARLCPLPDGIFVTVGPLTPLDDRPSRSRWRSCGAARD